MNSFRFIERGIHAEIARQEAILRGGGEVEQETLHFDPRTEAITLAALQGGGARLPLLPRARPRPGRHQRGDARARARRAARAARGARRALRARPGPDARHGAPARVPRRARRLLRGGAGDATAPSAQPLANWVNELVARIDDEDPAESKVAPGALATLVGLVSEQTVTQGGASRCSTGSWPTAATPPRSSRPRAWAPSAAATSSTPSSRPRSTPTPTPPRRSARGNMKPIGRIVGHVMRETKGRADGGEVTRIVREKLGL